MMDMDPNDICNWQVEKLEAGLAELGITTGVK